MLKKSTFTGLLLVVCSAHANNITSTEVLTAYPEYTGEYPGFSLVLDERFDEFNQAIWKTGDGAVGVESACRFQPQGVQVIDGILTLLVQEEAIAAGWSDDHQQEKNAYEFSCGEVHTHPHLNIRYGRLEARMKAPNRATASGYISSLFTYTNDIDPQASADAILEWEEIDVELEGGRPDKFQANLIYGVNTWEWWRTRAYGAWEDKIVVGPVDEWRVFAIEWLPDAIKWYVDGELVKTLHQDDTDCKPKCIGEQRFPAPIPDNPTQLFVNFWIPNDAIQDTFGGNKARNRYPMKTEYDWIRYYQLDTHPVEWSASPEQ
ncbi:glycoside hydrolase family 16 protein [Alteromonas flava]|uniref:glycoside hydrolase family 16 protein n=1 Tax=Alteromonas flava TaxID=2048003 RepID=UPI000C2880FD|nr:family 16 glycosylhydrolase [Alteromonas flava]